MAGARELGRIQLLPGGLAAQTSPIQTTTLPQPLASPPFFTTTPPPPPKPGRRRSRGRSLMPAPRSSPLLLLQCMLPLATTLTRTLRLGRRHHLPPLLQYLLWQLPASPAVPVVTIAALLAAVLMWVRVGVIRQWCRAVKRSRSRRRRSRRRSGGGRRRRSECCRPGFWCGVRLACCMWFADAVAAAVCLDVVRSAPLRDRHPDHRTPWTPRPRPHL